MFYQFQFVPVLNLVPDVVSAQALGLPLLPPSIPEEKTGKFSTGANFAVWGSFALSPDYYRKRYNLSADHGCLDSQLGSFKTVLARIAPGKVTYSCNKI